MTVEPLGTPREIASVPQRVNIESYNMEYLLPDTEFNAVHALIQVSTKHLLCAGTGHMTVSKAPKLLDLGVLESAQDLKSILLLPLFDR